MRLFIEYNLYYIVLQPRVSVGYRAPQGRSLRNRFSHLYRGIRLRQCGSTRVLTTYLAHWLSSSTGGRGSCECLPYPSAISKRLHVFKFREYTPSLAVELRILAQSKLERFCLRFVEKIIQQLAPVAYTRWRESGHFPYRSFWSCSTVDQSQVVGTLCGQPSQRNTRI